jgi:hypothetical protein
MVGSQGRVERRRTVRGLRYVPRPPLSERLEFF